MPRIPGNTKNEVFSLFTHVYNAGIPSRKDKIPGNIFLLKSQDTGGQTSHVLPSFSHSNPRFDIQYETMMKLAALVALAGSASAFAPATNGNSILYN